MTNAKLLICSMALATAGMLGGASAHAQTYNSTTRTSTGSENATTQKSVGATFLAEAASGDMAEVQLGQLAQQKTSSAAVKQFGQRMVTDHSKNETMLKQIAAQDNVTLPTAPSAKDQKTYDKLSKLSGAEFDREYMSTMVQDHEKDVAQFKKEASANKNPSIQKYASETLPVLKEHLNLARQTDREIGANASNTNTGAKPAQ